MRQLLRNNLTRRRARVVEVAPLGRTLRRVVLAGDDLADFDHRPGQWIALYTGGPGRRGGWPRNYTIRRYDPADRSLELLVHLHGNGPASRLLAELAVGADVRLTGPLGWTPPVPEADWYLLAGDESALASIAVRLESLPAGAPVRVLVELRDADDRIDLPGVGHAGNTPAGGGPERSRPASAAAGREVEVTWAVRPSDAAAGTALEPLLDGAELPAGHGHALLYGEIALAQAIRSHLLGQRGWQRGQVHIRPHWTRGRSGL